MVGDSANEVEGSDQASYPTTMTIADGMQQGAIADAAPLPALPDEGEIPLLDMRTCQQLAQSFATCRSIREEVMELHLQVDDFIDQA